MLTLRSKLPGEKASDYLDDLPNSLYELGYELSYRWKMGGEPWRPAPG